MKKKVFIIAEAGINHNGRLDLAYKLIDKAKSVGADAVKFQIFKADELVTKKAKKAHYVKSNDSQYNLMRKLELSQTSHLKLKKHCKIKKIKYLCSAFDIISLKFLKKNNLDTFKIPSGEITNYSYLQLIGAFKKKVILSTGMSTIIEIKNALNILLSKGLKKSKITLLQCNSDYPSSYKDINLRAMLTLKRKFKVRVGLSDHSPGIEVPIAACALGAQTIEKHFTLDENMKGPDHKASLNPHEFSRMVKSIRNVEEAMGSYKKIVTMNEKKTKKAARKSIVALKNIMRHERFTHKNIGVKRPGSGISAAKFDLLIGKKSKNNFKIGDLIKN